MRQSVLQFQFQTSVDARGFNIRSSDLPDFSMYFSEALSTEGILDILEPAMKMYLWGYGLQPERHMIVLNDPQADLACGGSFKSVVVPKPL